MRGIYIASRVKWAARWRNLRDNQMIPFISTWIDEAGEGETKDLGELWERVVREVERCRVLLLYAEPEDFPLKGALVEVGAALMAAKPIFVCLPNVVLEERSCRPLGSWVNHASVKRIDLLINCLTEARRL